MPVEFDTFCLLRLQLMNGNHLPSGVLKRSATLATVHRLKLAEFGLDA